jgi:hypothetical protein
MPQNGQDLVYAVYENEISMYNNMSQRGRDLV